MTSPPPYFFLSSLLIYIYIDKLVLSFFSFFFSTSSLQIIALGVSGSREGEKAGMHAHVHVPIHFALFKSRPRGGEEGGEVSSSLCRCRAHRARGIGSSEEWGDVGVSRQDHRCPDSGAPDMFYFFSLPTPPPRDELGIMCRGVSFHFIFLRKGGRSRWGCISAGDILRFGS